MLARLEPVDFQLIADSIPHIVWMATEDGSTDYFNRQGIEYTGGSREANYGRDWVKFVHPEDAVAARDAWEHAIRNKEPYRLDYRIRNAKGEFRWHAFRALPICAPNGRVLKWIGTATDIDDAKNLESELHRLLDSVVGAIAAIVEARDPYTAGHERRVAHISVAIAAELGLDPHTVEGIKIAAEIHDIGKVSIPVEILARPTKLTAIEFDFVKTHPMAGYQMVKGIPFPWPVAEMILQHHERFDGSGYPAGLSGDQIGIGARIIAVADVVEAMSSHRPYRPGLGIQAGLDEIARESGTHYDPKIVGACLQLFKEGRLTIHPIGAPSG